MSYSVNFSENGDNIVLEKVVVDGKEYTPSADTVVFTKNTSGNLMKNTSLDLTKIDYTSPGTVVSTTTGAGASTAASTTTGAGLSAASTALTTTGAGLSGAATGKPVAGLSGAGPTAIVLSPPPVVVPTPENALVIAQTAIFRAIKIAQNYKNAIFLSGKGGGADPTVSDAIEAVGTAIAAVEGASTIVDAAIAKVPDAITLSDPAIQQKYKDAKKQLEAINRALNELNELLNKFKVAFIGHKTTQFKLETAINNVFDEYKNLIVEYNKLLNNPLKKGGAPLRFGSSSSKTKRNRRRNRRFAKKSYKRRH